MTRVLVTGGSGFVGRATARALVDAGYEVHIADVRPGDVPSTIHHRVDLLNDSAAWREVLSSVRPTHLLHAAWVATPGVYWRSPDNLRWLEASLSLTRTFAEAGGRRMLGVGSCAEYDWRFGYCTEEHCPLAPGTLYGASKDALRRVLEAYAAEVDLSFAWARLFFVYGPFEAPGRLVPSVCRALLRGEATQCTSGKQVRDFLHIEDVGRALAVVLTSDLKGAVNIGSGEPVSVRTIVEQLADVAGRPDLARFGDLPDPTSEPSLLVADTRRLGSLGFRPRYEIRDGLAAVFDWWRNQPT